MGTNMLITVVARNLTCPAACDLRWSQERSWEKGESITTLCSMRDRAEQIFKTTLMKAKKSKAVPLHATEALGGRGGIAPTHSDLGTRWGWVVSVVPRPRFAPGKGPLVSIVQEAGWASEVRGKILCPCWGSNPDRPVVQSVVRHYTDWATPD
jgi:hypothetical protein